MFWKKSGPSAEERMLSLVESVVREQRVCNTELSQALIEANRQLIFMGRFVMASKVAEKSYTVAETMGYGVMGDEIRPQSPFAATGPSMAREYDPAEGVEGGAGDGGPGPLIGAFGEMDEPKPDEFVIKFPSGKMPPPDEYDGDDEGEGE